MSILRSLGVGSKTFQSLFLLLALLCASVLSAMPAHAADDVTSAVLASGDYIIGAEDVLDISVWKNSDLSRVVNVRPDGKISLPLIGDVQAAGLTPNQLRDKIVQMLKQYQQTAVVSVGVQSINSYKIFIVGEVQAPGVYQLKARTSILQALAIAGGLTQFASKSKIRLIRRKSDGTEESIRVRFNDLVYGDDDNPELNIMLQAGDTIFVP